MQIERPGLPEESLNMEAVGELAPMDAEHVQESAQEGNGAKESKGAKEGLLRGSIRPCCDLLKGSCTAF